MNYDLIIIGGGPGGYNAATLAAKNGLKTALFEKNKLGGVCLNEGCIPTKTLLYSANMLDTIRSSQKYGITIDGSVGADYGKIVSRKNKIVRKLVLGVTQKLKTAGVDVIEATARLAGSGDESIRVEADGQIYTARDVLLCTGSETSIPPIEGLAESGYWTSREALEAKELPESIVVIGGGVIGMEFVSIYTSLGVKVTVVEMLPKILGRMDTEISTALMHEYERRGVTFLLNTRVVSASPKGITVETADGETRSIEADRILLSAGRRAITKDLGVEELGLSLHRGAIVTDEYMQTSHPHVYAAGDVTGRSMLAHAAIRMGEVAVHHILGRKDDVMRYDAIPGVVYTHPEIASVGVTEDEMIERGTAYRVLKLPMTFSGRFVVENEGETGIFKVIVDGEDRIIGGQMLGNPASELIVMIGMAITERLTLEDLRKHIFPHPTAAEILHEVIYE